MVTTPYGSETYPSIKALPLFASLASEISVEPPPISKTKARLTFFFNKGRQPITASRDSSCEEIISKFRPVCRLTSPIKSLQFFARRQAAVATKRARWIGEYSLMISEHIFNALIVRRLASRLSSFSFIIPSPKRVMREKVSMI